MGFRRRRWRDIRPEEEKVKVNRAIRVPEVRLVTDDGQQLGIMATEAARDIASRSGMDLVEIAPGAKPPVCKIMDYGRYKYELKKKASTARKAQHQSTVKEIKMRPRIDDHDLDFKLKNARNFLSDGDKVKCTCTFRGRENLFSEAGHDLLRRVAEQLAEVSTIEQRPRREGRSLFLVLAPSRAALEKLKAQRSKSKTDHEQERDEQQEHEEPAARAGDELKEQESSGAEDQN